MVSKKTFIITVVAISIGFIAILMGTLYYHFHTVEQLKKEKEGIKIVQNSEVTGLENVVIE